MHFSHVASLLFLIATTNAHGDVLLHEEKPAGYNQALIFPYASATFEAIAQPIRWLANPWFIRKPANTISVNDTLVVTSIPTYANWNGDRWSVFVHGNALAKRGDLKSKKLDRLLNRMLIRARVPREKDNRQRRNGTRHWKHYPLTSHELRIAQNRAKAIASTALRGFHLSAVFCNGTQQQCKDTHDHDTSIMYKTLMSNATGKDGAFSELVHLSPGWGTTLAGDSEQHSNVTFGLVSALAGDGLAKANFVNLSFVPPRGITFLSDVDDILRVAEVWNIKQAILSTLARDFVPWRNMPAIFSHWRDSVPGAHFHYSSDTPELDGKFYVNGIFDHYPRGSVDLRPMDWTN